MNNNTDGIAPPLKMENMDGDGIPDSELSQDATDVFKIKALELLDKLQVELEEIKETYRREAEARNREREEQITREREMLKNYDELRKQMQLWPQQTTNTLLRRPIPPVQVAVLPVRSSEMILSGSSEEEQTEMILSGSSEEQQTEMILSVSSVEEQSENIEASDDFNLEVEESDLEEDEETVENNEDEQEEIEEDDEIEDNNAKEQEEIEEDDETEENNAEELEEIEEDDEIEDKYAEEEEEMEDPDETGGEESLENVLEYTPVASEIELPHSTGRTEGVKRKASSLLEADNSKRPRLTLVECPVCQESLPEMTRSGKMLLLAPKCGHVMCSNCAMRIWSQRQKRCPTCNTLFNIDKLLPVYL